VQLSLPLQGTGGEWKPHFFVSEHGAKERGDPAPQPAQQDTRRGGGKDPGKARESRSGSLQPTESLECVSCPWPGLTRSSHTNRCWGWSFRQSHKPNLLSKHHPFLTSSDAGTPALVCFLDVSIEHLGLHKYSQSCLRAPLYVLLFSLAQLYAWRAWIAATRSPSISHSPVPWKNRGYGSVARESRQAMPLQACLAVTYLLQLACFLFTMAKSELSIAKPVVHLSLVAGYSQSYSF